MQVLPYEVQGWGMGEIWLDGEVVVNHELPRARGQVLQSSSGVAMQDLTPLLERVQSYFEGEAVSFADVELDLSWTTPFHAAVTETLRAIPHGEVITYGELAALAGHPNAQRAAGTYCARNRFPLFVPCHRVVAANGLGSYGSLGLEYKRRLLKLEHAL